MHQSKNTVVIGAGIGGLMAAIALKQSGHDIVVLEQAPEILEVGAGIQLAPNATKILQRFGLLDDVLKVASQPKGTMVRRYADDSEIGPRSHKKPSLTGCPMLVVYRADLHYILYNAAIHAGVTIKKNTRVVQIDDAFEARVRLASGEWLQAEAIVAADGVHSGVRKALARYLCIDDPVTPTGDAAYRVLISRERLHDKPDLLTQMDAGISTRWLGPGGHIMAYPIRQNSMLNMVLIHPLQPNIHETSNLWNQMGSKDELQEFYKAWSPDVRRLAETIDPHELMEWPLNARSNLPCWTLNKVALLGDACHPMLPYVAQGAAQAIEDAAVLAVCFAARPSVQEAFEAYEKLRKGRAEFIQSSAASLQHVFHLPDGPEQAERDYLMRSSHVTGRQHPDLWSDPVFQQTVWHKDVVHDAFQQLLPHLRNEELAGNISDFERATSMSRSTL